MSFQHPNVLFVGSPDRGHAFLTSVESHGWWVHNPQHTLEALGMFVTYWPDISVIDAESDFANDVLIHLRSIGAQPILVMTDDLHYETSDGIFAVPLSITDFELMQIVRDVLMSETQPEY